MPKLKKLFPNIFGTKSSSVEGKLETDALPVGTHSNSISINPTSSDEINSDIIESNQSIQSNPNYNSLETVNGNTSIAPSVANQSNILNTMNVNNGQSIMMQFSNMNQVHFGSVYNIGSDRSNSENGNLANSVKARRQSRTTTIVAMMNCPDEVNHRLRETISTHLGEGWKDVMRALGTSEGQIDQAIIDHQMHGGIKEVIYQLLLQWSRGAEDGEATVGRITNILWNLNHRDCVQRMKLAWKLNNEQK